ncbi:MAG: (2Fe-2S) ferredoxin domain-containing protein [Bacteroidales bacterium]|nr:(2Fe-2S) ferredoxin domain-containing protein [Bacteroidales bacterium]
MENPKKEIVICLGSSCFARGNKQLVKFISDYLRDRNLLNDVKFHGERCFGHCSKGPALKIEHEIHEKIDEEKILGLLDDFFLSIIQQDNYR